MVLGSLSNATKRPTIGFLDLRWIMVAKMNVSIVLVLVLCVMVMPVTAGVLFAEDFMTYPGGSGINDSTPGVNVNGCADWTWPIMSDSSGTPGVSGTFNPAQGVNVDYIGALMPGLSTTPHPGFAGALLGTEASGAPDGFGL